MQQYKISSGLAASSASSTNLLYKALTLLQQLGLSQQITESKMWYLAAWKLAHASYKELMNQGKQLLIQGIGTTSSGVIQGGTMWIGSRQAAGASDEAAKMTDHINKMDEAGVEGFTPASKTPQPKDVVVSTEAHETTETETTAPVKSEADKQAEFDKERKQLVKDRDRLESTAQQKQQTSSMIGRALGEMVQGISQASSTYYKSSEAKEKLNESVANYRSQVAQQMEGEMSDVSKNAYQQALAMGTLRTDQASADGQRV